MIDDPGIRLEMKYIGLIVENSVLRATRDHLIDGTPIAVHIEHMGWTIDVAVGRPPLGASLDVGIQIAKENSSEALDFLGGG